MSENENKHLWVSTDDSSKELQVLSMDSRDKLEQLVHVSVSDAIVPISQYAKLQATLWEITQAVAETDVTEYRDSVSCRFCNSEMGFVEREVPHYPECIVTKARELIKQREARPQMEIKVHTVADGTTIASALLHQKEAINQPSSLRQMAEEARRQADTGETEDGGFAIEGRAQ